jgi:hypothetical protein
MVGQISLPRMVWRQSSGIIVNSTALVAETCSLCAGASGSCAAPCKDAFAPNTNLSLASVVKIVGDVLFVSQAQDRQAAYHPICRFGSPRHINKRRAVPKEVESLLQDTRIAG